MNAKRWLWLPVVCAGVVSAHGISAQDSSDPAPNDPATMTWLGEEFEFQQAAGIVSLGGFEFGSTDTAAVDELLADEDIRWIETAHFEIGMGLPAYKVPGKERKVIDAELAELRLVLPEIPKKVARLDPWLRAIMFARRAEAVYAHVQELLQVTDSDFPEDFSYWLGQGEFWGMGPYLGQQGKYELLMLPGDESSLTYLRDSFGLIVRRTQRWNVMNRDTLMVVANDASDGLNRDAPMHAHVAYNLALNLLDGYRHYSFELPVWLRVGFGHLVARSINTVQNTFDLSEGGTGIDDRRTDWHDLAKKFVRDGSAPSMAELINRDDYADLSFEDHVTSWSMTQFLTEALADKYAEIVARLSARIGEGGAPDGSDLTKHHREAFREILGMSYAQFDQAWSLWLETEQADLLNDPKRRK